MFSIASLLERAKAHSNIESDYRLAKILRINQSALSNYRAGRSYPNAEICEALCALSGDDAGMIMAQIEAAKAPSLPVKNMWLSVAKRLAGGAQTAILSVLIFISLIAGAPSPAKADSLRSQIVESVDNLHIVSTCVFVRLERLRQRWRGFPAFLRFYLAACW